MDWKQFIVALLDAVAWPAAVLVGFFCLRKGLVELIPLARKVKYKDLELEFGEGVIAASKEAEAAFPEAAQADPKAKLIAMAGTAPKRAVMEAWVAVHSAAVKVLVAKGGADDVAPDSSNRFLEVEGALRDAGLLAESQLKLYAELRRLRNKVAHAEQFEIGRGEAILYVELCLTLADHLGTVAG